MEILEWCYDGYSFDGKITGGDNGNSVVIDPVGPINDGTSVVRGGYSTEDKKKCASCSVTYRSFNGNTKRGTQGIRLVRSAQ